MTLIVKKKLRKLNRSNRWSKVNMSSFDDIVAIVEPSSTMEMISIVDDIVDEIVTCGRVFSVNYVTVRLRDS